MIEMEPRLFVNPLDELYLEPKKDYESLFKNLIIIFFIFLTCIIVAIVGVVLFQVSLFHCEKCEEKPETSNSSIAFPNELSYSFNSMKPVQLEYIWPDNVEKLVNDIVDNNMHITNDDRAVLIKTELMRFKTTDVFYIIVYRDTKSPQNHAFHGSEPEYITVFKPGKCNVVVYRSRYWRGSPESALTTVTKEVKETCGKGIVMNSDDYTDIPKELYKNFHDINFLGVIDKRLDVAIRSANSFGRGMGPGYWSTIQVLDSKTKKSTGKEFVLIAGYK